MALPLREAFRSYADTARSRLQRRAERGSGADLPRLFLHESVELRALTNGLEMSGQFQRLVEATAQSSLWQGYHGKSAFNCRRTVGNFFRRSGYYLDVYDGKPVSMDALFEKYREAFEKRRIRTSYVVPLELVHFHEESMDFGRFQVRRSSLEELTARFQNRVREAFWPRSAIDVNRLEQYWCLELTCDTDAPRLGRVCADLSALPRAHVDYTAYPRPVERALEQLALFDWQPDWSGPECPEWAGFGVPFVLKLDDSLLEGPAQAPDMSKLEMVPVCDNKGEEIGQEPVTWFHLDSKQTLSFKGVVEEVVRLSESLEARRDRWEFLEVAMRFCVKAFFSEGLEQMLWHITVLEALFGEKKQGVMDTLARRIAGILGNTNRDRERIRKSFKKLYGFRSSLVHGNPSRDDAEVQHLHQARDFARRSLVWFLRCLGWLETQMGGEQSPETFPTRQEVLKAIDLSPQSRTRLCGFLDAVPSGFPYVQGWAD